MSETATQESTQTTAATPATKKPHQTQVVNTGRHSVHVRSHDGDSVTIPPGGRTRLHDKFLWNLPKEINITTDTIPVAKKTPTKPVTPTIVKRLVGNTMVTTAIKNSK